MYILILIAIKASVLLLSLSSLVNQKYINNKVLILLENEGFGT